MEQETNLPEEEVSMLTLTAENGQDVDFEYLDCLEYQGKEYLVLMPEARMRSSFWKLSRWTRKTRTIWPWKTRLR